MTGLFFKVIEGDIRNLDLKAFNIGYGIKTTLNQLVEMLSNIFNKKVPIQYKESRPGDIRESVTDNSKIVNDLGFNPDFTIYERLKELVNYSLRQS